MRRIATMALLTTIAFAGLAGAATAQERDTRPEPLRLACRVVAEAPASVACEWSPSQSRAFAGYRLTRFDDENGRVPVFRTNRRFENTAVDRGVRPGRYLYWVAAFDRAGRVIGLSDAVVVIVEPAVRGG